ncbi:MAG: HNH endonuclease [Chloroflexi bacterium]|nr:HNH endonuclease [Chloroflexota bacterium]
MNMQDDRLHVIFEKTAGRCFHCGKKLSFNAYGRVDGRGSWEIDHSNPLSRGGTDNLSNLVPSCLACNRSKGGLTSTEFGSGRYLDPKAPKPLIHPKKKIKNATCETWRSCHRRSRLGTGASSGADGPAHGVVSYAF